MGQHSRARKISMQLESNSFLDLSIESKNQTVQKQPPTSIHRHRYVQSSSQSKKLEGYFQRVVEPTPLKQFHTIESFKNNEGLSMDKNKEIKNSDQNKKVTNEYRLISQGTKNPYESQVSQMNLSKLKVSGRFSDQVIYQMDNETLKKQLEDQKNIINNQKQMIQDILTKQRGLEEHINKYQKQAKSVKLNYEEESYEIFGINFQNHDFMKKHQAVIFNKEIKYQSLLREMQAEMNRYKRQYEELARSQRTSETRQLRKDLKIQIGVNLQLRQQFQTMEVFPGKQEEDKVQRMIENFQVNKYDEVSARVAVTNRKNKAIEEKNRRLNDESKKLMKVHKQMESLIDDLTMEVQLLNEYKHSTQESQKQELKEILDKEYKERLQQKDTVIEYQLQAQQTLKRQLDDKYKSLWEENQSEKCHRLELESKYQDTTEKYRLLAQNFCESQINRRNRE